MEEETQALQKKKGNVRAGARANHIKPISFKWVYKINLIIQ